MIAFSSWKIIANSPFSLLSYIRLPGNKEFLRVCGFAQTGPYSSLTVFDLVMPSVLPQLHQIFLTALYEGFPNSLEYRDGSNLHYLALTVPCIELSACELSYFITVSSCKVHNVYIFQIKMRISHNAIIYRSICSFL